MGKNDSRYGFGTTSGVSEDTVREYLQVGELKRVQIEIDLEKLYEEFCVV